uniref:Uncharacterized protein n=1 Tax=Psilocybe cubensis TaxID=181762 RepID=A0A8H8CDU2_PSICU
MGFDLRFGRPVNIEQKGLVTESWCRIEGDLLPRMLRGNVSTSRERSIGLSTPTQHIDFPRAADLPNLYIECLNARTQCIDFPRGDLLEDIQGELSALTRHIDFKAVR